MKKIILLLLLSNSLLAQPRWPAVTQQNKPWTRWWWMGSAVNQKDLTSLLDQYKKAGLGGVEITPIYGVKGEERNFINFLSPKWMSMLDHTLKEANRLGMGVDLAQASGWPFGGPWVSPADACKYVAYKTYSLKSGEKLTEPVTYIQQPLVRTVGEKIDSKQLVEPIAKNPNLQRHAFDQVRFEKPLPLQTLMAYSDKGQTVDLTAKVDSKGALNWTAPEGRWTLYAVFQGWHGKMVERAGPGGEGDVIDHFSKTATQHYLQKFDEAFKGRDLKTLRAFFNDSYEVDDAQGESNWTPALFEEFKKRHGYDLRNHLAALFGKDSDEKNGRVLTDYRATISELLLENYTKTWSAWAKTKGKIIRNQAANVTGKKLTSSESATWDNEHFLSKLSDIKKDMDRFLLGGVNHTFYHGTNYSPQNAAWPGWLFYAAVHFNPNNTFWNDFGKLNQYVARCQSFLQAGKPNNDVLVYLPIYDSFTRPGKVLLQHYDGIEHGFKGLPVEEHAETLWKKGYGFDFISDKQLLNVTAANGKLQTGGVAYQTVLVPEARYMPGGTFQQLIKLAQNGATVVFINGLPEDVPGFGNLETRRAAFKKGVSQLKFTESKGIRKAAVGQGAFLIAKNADALLVAAGVKREKMVDGGLQMVRRSHASGNYYFVANGGEKAVDGWFPLSTAAKSVALYNPMTEKLGMAGFRPTADGGSEVYLQLAPGESCILETANTVVSGPAYAYWKPAGSAQAIKGKWTINFLSGGPQLPAKKETENLGSWTDLDGDYVKSFSGTASYTISFPKPEGTGAGWLLSLGKVAESARVRLNGQEIGTLIGPTYQLFIPKDQLKATNELTVFVSNSMANRIAELDREHINWKKFYNINMSARLRENRGADGNFTAEKWKPRESGLIGPVTLMPVKGGKGGEE